MNGVLDTFGYVNLSLYFYAFAEKSNEPNLTSPFLNSTVDVKI